MSGRRLALALLGLCGLAGPALAQGNDGSFNLTNQSGRSIERLYASPRRSSDWGDERLGGHPLAEGSSTAVRMPPEGGCRSDIRLIFADGLTEERRDINTCLDRNVVIGTPERTGTLRVGPDGEVQAPQGNPSVVIANGGRQAIRSLFASPATHDDWGKDRLGDDTIEPGTEFHLDLPEGACQYDLRAIWANGRSEERRDINLCEADKLTFR